MPLFFFHTGPPNFNFFKVFYYSAGVFATSGIPEDMIQYAVLGTGAINVIMTAISVI